MKSDVLSVKDCVALVLSEDARARSDDKWLILQVLRRMGYKIFIPYEEMGDMPSFESITRCRRKIQEGGEFLAFVAVQGERRQEQAEMTEINTWF